MATVATIIKQYLKDNGCDGLAGDTCGCGIDDLCACNEYMGDCQPAIRVDCDQDNCPNPDGCIDYGDEKIKAVCYRPKEQRP